MKTIPNSRIVSLVLILAVVVAAFPQAVLAAPLAQTSCARTHTVKSGENLTTIADIYDVSWSAIALANDLKSPYVIYVGQSLCIPASSSSTGTSGSTTTSKKASFEAELDGKWLVITTSNFSKNSSYFVKVDKDSKWPFSWKKIGTLKIRKTTSVTRTYLLPKELRSDKAIYVCLKNAITDKVLCEKAFR